MEKGHGIKFLPMGPARVQQVEFGLPCSISWTLCFVHGFCTLAGPTEAL